jgi:hypothetical protein
MRKLGHGGSDSLELLLDTVCSMFGAILLIAILVALMAKTATVEPGDQAGMDIVRRRVDVAQRDLDQVRQLLATTKVTQDTTGGELFEEKKKLELAVSAARAIRRSESAEIEEKISKMGMDPGAQVNSLKENLKVQQREIAELANKLTAQNVNLRRANERIAEISSLIRKSQDSRALAFRFPKERMRTKEPFAVICRYNKIYPIADASGRQNKETIKWVNVGKDSELSEPIPDQGMEHQKHEKEIQRLLDSVNRSNTYMTFYVYDDSFEPFQFIRDLAVKRNLDYGLAFKDRAADLIWSSEGSSPPPQ